MAVFHPPLHNRLLYWDKRATRPRQRSREIRPLAVLFHSPDDDAQAWRRALERRLPGIDVRIWPEAGEPAEIEAALVWRVPPGILRRFPRLALIQSLGAGVDGLLADPDLPQVPLCRLVDGSMARSMSEFVLAQVLKYHRRLNHFAAEQRAGRWSFALPEPPRATRVGIMGLGELGRHAAGVLVGEGFTVRGWSRSPRELSGGTAFAGADGLEAFLAGTDVLVCLLPLTSATRGILDARLLAGLPLGARLVNVGRGAHLVEADLLAALDGGRLAHASLDCFAEEPLPPGHPFWSHPRIDVTPHVAAFADPESAADEVAENLRRLRDGRPLRHLVDRAQGY
jgi:glyoxylate/hydroxypyruvate reductase A